MTRSPGTTAALSGAAAGIALLYGRAVHIAKRTKDAAVSRSWPQDLPAALAVIKPLAGIGWHGFSFNMPALGAGNCRCQFD